jgi:2-dehydro-3-deoxygluconokinase
MSIQPVVLLGETMALFHASHAPLERNASLTATFGGAETNVAVALARLGRPARWLSAVGDDPFGQMIVKTLRGEGIDVSRVQFDPDHPTGLMVKLARPAGEPAVFYYRRGSAFSHATPQTFEPDAWRDAAAIYLSGITPALSPGCLELTRHVLRDARARGIPTWFDPNYRSKLWSQEQARQTLRPLLGEVDTLLLGLSEATLLTGLTGATEAAAALMQLGPSRVILKQGSDGATYFDANATHTAPAHAITVVDPIGAGDAFGAGFLSAHLDGLPPPQCLARACALGAFACLTPGDWESLPTAKELDDFLTRRSEAAR